MNLKKDFTELECDFFRAVCNFTPDERRIFDMKVQDHSGVEIALKMGISESSVHRRVKGIKAKILRVL